jgi:hypothetical protein
MRRREFITLLSTAIAWPAVAHAQAPLPVVGFLSGNRSDLTQHFTAAFAMGSPRLVLSRARMSPLNIALLKGISRGCLRKSSTLFGAVS